MTPEAATLSRKRTPRKRCERCGRYRVIRYWAGFRPMCSLECVNRYRVEEGFPPIIESRLIERA